MSCKCTEHKNLACKYECGHTDTLCINIACSERWLARKRIWFHENSSCEKGPQHKTAAKRKRGSADLTDHHRNDLKDLLVEMANRLTKNEQIPIFRAYAQTHHLTYTAIDHFISPLRAQDPKYAALVKDTRHGAVAKETQESKDDDDRDAQKEEDEEKKDADADVAADNKDDAGQDPVDADEPKPKRTNINVADPFRSTDNFLTRGKAEADLAIANATKEQLQQRLELGRVQQLQDLCEIQHREQLKQIKAAHDKKIEAFMAEAAKIKAQMDRCDAKLKAISDAAVTWEQLRVHLLLASSTTSSSVSSSSSSASSASSSSSASSAASSASSSASSSSASASSSAFIPAELPMPSPLPLVLPPPMIPASASASASASGTMETVTAMPPPPSMPHPSALAPSSASASVSVSASAFESALIPPSLAQKLTQAARDAKDLQQTKEMVAIRPLIPTPTPESKGGSFADDFLRALGLSRRSPAPASSSSAPSLASAAGSSGSTATATDQAKGKEPQFPPGVLVIKSTTSGNWTREPNDFNRVLDWVFESSPINVPQFGKGYRLQQFPLAKDPKESLQTLCELVREVNDVPPTFKTVVLNGLSFAPHSNGHLGKIPGLLCDAHVNSGAMPKVLGIITPPRNTNLYQRIANNGPQLTTIVCVTVGCQMAYALGQLLDAKKCHKDVRLINIHLGENHRATLGGYCSSAMNAVFARQTGAIKVQPSSSYDNVIHEAPELRPALVYTPAVHVYALGMVLYALASWSIPGRGMANKDIADLIQKGNGPMAFAPYPTDRDLIKLADIACKCCAFNPAQRPSIEQALKLLAELHHRLTTAVPSNTPASVSRGFYHAVRS